MELQLTCEDISNDIRKYKISTKAQHIAFSWQDFTFSVIALIALFLHPLHLFSWIGSILLFLFSSWMKRGQIVEESLVVIRDLGVQLETKSYGGKKTHLFIDKARIKSIIINEGIKSYDFILYMAFIVEGNNKTILTFRHLFPKLKDLIPIYRGTRAIMFGELED
eukprot:TRINITY_DN14878_c0_g1_i2.p1 TRINITY_DN14878_c0_g1~~TRINITY_DN14878_c0_g1_i2.p1  ORF type:complete len:165 (+),score=25.07 TRINITY_DN14878_c0_g1_i2:90-584(+)